MNQTIKAMLRKYPAIYEPLSKIYRIFRPVPPPTIALIQMQILKHLKHKKSVFFVQVGSADGLQGDPIHDLIISHPKWKGIFIEPVPFLFEKLKRNYNHSEQFIFENIAISTKRGVRKFYYVSEEAKAELGDILPFWYEQLGSYYRNHIPEHLNGILDPYIVEEEIETITLQEIFDRNDIVKIDLIHIDTEKFDYKVLSQVDFLRYKPCVVLYETFHLSNAEKNSAESLLRKHNYNCVPYDRDTLALFKG
ncbi:FkbM family methyltransferase [Chloroflexota bacterium]